MSVYYDLYLKDVFDLAHSFVIKSKASCNLMNRYVSLLGEDVNLSEPKTWRYYKHLNGEYHSVDEPMEIVSLDTTDTILFSKENMEIHKATHREYSKRNTFVEELIDRFPEQELLIKGIITPIDLDTAINADDHTILCYNRSLVEAGESRFIHKVQERIDQFFLRWDNEQFVYADVYYVAGLMAVFYSNLIQFIINVRLDECKTDFAHSFHIKEYLKSKGRLDLFYDFMTDKQRLYFYRNILFLNRNSGKQEIFEELTQKVLTDRSFPLDEYNLRQTDDGLVDTLKSTVEMHRSPVNEIQSASNVNVKSVSEILRMEALLAIDNENEIVHAEQYIPRMMRRSLSGDLETKVLESHTLDTSQGDIYSLEDILLNHWVYMSNVGLFTSTISVVNPLTGDAIRLSVKDAFIMFLYTYNAARGFKLTDIPFIEAKRVVRNLKPTKTELSTLIDTDIVDPSFIDIAHDIGINLPTVISVEGFRNSMDEVHDAMIKHRNLWALRKDWRQRIHVKQMTERMYMDYPVDLAQGMLYDTWFRERAIDITELSELEMELLSTELLMNATGADLRTGKTFQEIHEAMVKLMERLSSYSVQFIQKTNSLRVVYTDRPYIRPGHQERFRKHLQRIKLTPFRVFKVFTKSKHHWVVNAGGAAIVNQTSRPKHRTTTSLAWVINQGISKRAQDIAKFGFCVFKIPLGEVSLKDIEGVVTGYEGLTDGVLSDLFTHETSSLYKPFTAAEVNYYRNKLGSLTLQ